MSSNSALKVVDMVTALHDLRARLSSRIGLPIETEPTDLSLAELSQLSDAEAVFRAHTAIFGHPPPLIEFRRHVAALRSKKITLKELLEMMVRSPEGRSRGTKIAFDTIENSPPRNQTDVVQIFRVGDFFDGDVDEFLTRAYRILLNREIDPSGMESHRDAMRQGISPAQILAALMDSDEYRGRHVHIIIEELSTPSDIMKIVFDSINSLSSLVMDIEYKLEKERNKR